MASKEKKITSQQDDPVKADLVRRFKANPLVFIGTVTVLIIVIVAFVFVPAIVPSAGGFSTELSFGSYNKIPLAYVPGNYFASKREDLTRMYQQYGFPVSDSSEFVWRQAFEETVVHTGILDEMKTAGYTAPAKVVDRKVAELSVFQENGVFSVSRYRMMDKTSRMSLWRRMQEDIAKEYYLTDLTNLSISSKETPFIVGMGSVKRNFDMVQYSIWDYPETEIKTYTDTHRDLFAVVHLSQISIITSEREAQQVLASVQNGTSTFEDAARTHSKDGFAEKGGDLGIKMAYEFIALAPDPAERESLMKLSKGELSGLIKVKVNNLEGWGFFRAEEAPRQADLGDSAMLDKIRSYIMTFERGQVEDYYLEQAQAFIAEVKDASFDEVITLREMENQKSSFGPVPLNYGSASLFNTLEEYSSGLTSAVYNVDFWQTAFSTPLLTLSKPFVIGDNVVILHPTEQIIEDEQNIVRRENAYPSQMSNFTGENIRSYFLNNQKLTNRFSESFSKYFGLEN